MADKEGFKDKGLKGFIKALKSPPHVRVGIFAGKTSREASTGKAEPTNATIGAAHEYGSPSRNLPQRSFLRMPINDHLDQEIKKVPKLAQSSFAQAAKAGTLYEFLKLLGVTAERTIRLAFASNGFGKWPSLVPGPYRNKKTVNNILVETTQLRESIQSKVEK